MKYNLYLSTGILLTVFVILIGCGADESPPELPDIEYRLVITDSIGVETGDAEYILGWPVSLTHSPEGDIAFVDRMKHAVFMYTPDGKFIRTVGREGEGPGEFHMPGGLNFYSNGNLLIRDQDGIALFDSNYEYQDQMTWPFLTPSIVSALDSGGFIGRRTTAKPDEGMIKMVSTLARWDGDEDSSMEYFSLEFEWSMEPDVIDFTRSREHTIYCCATRDGRVFYSQSSIDKFEIHGCEPDGTPFLHIEDETFHRVRISEEELQTEMDNYNSVINMMTGGSPIDIPVELDLHKRAVLGMFIDGFERLWVRLGCYPGIIYRVYDMTGDILFHAELEYNGNPLDLISWKITGDEHGFLGYDTSHDQYQRVNMLELTEAE
ncbi:MAG: 6-bladed beta-propeller [Candidatus Aegiribacteria sp.]|nr:6-bladed beta-propeller [Candidatus Aegiribacteria sp.]